MKLASLESGAGRILRALDQRILTIAPELLGRAVAPQEGPAGILAAALLPELIASTGTVRGPKHWLLLTALGAAFPTAAEVEQFARQVELDDPDCVARDLFARFRARGRVGSPDLEMDLVTDEVVVDVDFCARNDKNTGIQRVTRAVMPRWHRERNVRLVAHNPSHSAYRSIGPIETARVLEWGMPVDVDADAPAFERRLVVPWRTTVLWPEVPDVNAMRRLAGLAQYSGNEVGVVGYDMIPVVSGHLRAVGEGGHFSQYLSAIKHTDRVAGISVSATAEFEGFRRMLGAQGLAGPRVLEVELGEEAGGTEHAPYRENGRPVVLITGRREPHKNVRACLQAAHRLWAEGLDFEVVTLGGAGWKETNLDQTIAELKELGYPLTTLGWVTDQEMWDRIAQASCVVFASLHEGYGLPVSEALALGTPVITTAYGSQREIAERGGCLLVDPRSDAAIAEAMRTLITEPATLAQLRTEVSERVVRTWAQYADELWSFLVDGKEAKA